MELFRPVKGARNIDWRLTQGWGVDFIKDGKLFYKSLGYNGHMGLDYAGPSPGSIVPCYSAHAGVVISAGDDGGWGKHIKIQHSEGFVTNYAHLSQIHVKVGDKVGAMQEIGLIGTTGNSTAVHLHFGFMPQFPNLNNGFKGYVDPTPHIKNWEETEQETDARVQRFVEEMKLKQPSKTKTYSQYDMCIILSKMHEKNH